jgi:hypothetical protein
MISVLSNNPVIAIILTVNVNVIQQLGQELSRATEGSRYLRFTALTEQDDIFTDEKRAPTSISTLDLLHKDSSGRVRQ